MGLFGKSKHKCCYCGDKRKETPKYKAKVYTINGNYKVYCCHTCGRLRGLF